MELWKNIPGEHRETPTITYYEPENRRGNAAVVIFPGGGYCGRTGHEGAGYAEFLNAAGVPAFVVDYRVAPHSYPLPLLDARRGVRWARAHAEEYGLDPQKIAVMGSSAGGHLAAITATCDESFPEEQTDEIDAVDPRPNAQILCYPVLCAPDGDVSHWPSYQNLIGGKEPVLEAHLDPVKRAKADTPPAFIWHTADDAIVDVINSYRYAEALRRQKVPVELHVFPNGPHGLGVTGSVPHAHQWTGLLVNWLTYIGWREE